jgi:hypothetical protein
VTSSGGSNSNFTHSFMYQVDSETSLYFMLIAWGGTPFQYQAIMGVCAPSQNTGNPWTCTNSLPIATGTLQ